MQTIKGTEQVGQIRLFASETWPGADKETRQLLASAVVDEFHQQIRKRQLNIQWIPRNSSFLVRNGDSLDITELTEMVDDAYSNLLFQSSSFSQ